MATTLKLEKIDLDLNPSWRKDPASKPTPEEIATARRLLHHCKTYGTAIIRPGTTVLAGKRKIFLSAMLSLYRLPLNTKLAHIEEYTDPLTQQVMKYENKYMERGAEIAEKTGEYTDFINLLTPENMPMPSGGRNAIERWMHAFSERIRSERLKQLNPKPIVVREVPGFVDSMNDCGRTVFEISLVAAEYLAIALGMPYDTFVKLLVGGPHLLAPTGVNIALEYCMDACRGDEAAARAKYSVFEAEGFKDPAMQLAIVEWLRNKRYLLDAFHNDLNFWTFHMMSNMVGLAIWLANGERLLVEGMADDCLLIQTGRQLRHLTGGVIPAMYHELTTTPQMAEVALEHMQSGVAPYRVGAPLFVHVLSDAILEALFGMGDPSKYPPELAWLFVSKILRNIYGNG